MMLLLIIGITGDLGQRLAREALDRNIRVRGLARNPTKLTPTFQHALNLLFEVNLTVISLRWMRP